MGFPIALPLAIWAACAQTQIIPTDRSPFSAQVLAIGDTAVEVAEGSKLSQVPIDKLRRLSFSAASEASANPTSGLAVVIGTVDAGTGSPSVAQSGRQATLLDGSTFVYERFDLAAGKAEFKLTGELVVTLPISAVHRVQMSPLSEPQQTQWQAIAESRIAADIVVLIRSPEALEKLEGVISRVTPEVVSFDFGGQNIDAPLAKLAGVRFFTNASTAGTRPRSGDGATAVGPLTAIVVDRSGNRWFASRLSLPRGSALLEMNLQCGASLVLPVEHLREIDYSSGSMQYLAELEPLKREAMDRLQMGVEIPGAKGLVEGLFGARLQDLRRPGSAVQGPSLEFLGSGAVEYRVPADFSRLVGGVELRPSGSRFTACQVTVKLDNQVLWQQRLSELGQVWPIDVPVKSDGRLRIEVAAETLTPVGDVVLCHELRVVK
jgi:hypothetical protein